ncbi:SOS response-associated peptidase [Candidatus Formimonas warabiya]|uniref:Abasic site processing protein n=1 Tax=Formimonas warabiya TaxID=1761012 RepID=A0A3G1KML8_FORW1|nr:SOS response-associated peptidase [Candidatus Formimonas warabiya]ATW23703.1 hypothetical protein DCMF_01865 [Candidatus Formimonas warabiya]
MCGRFTLTISWDDLCTWFNLEQSEIEYLPRFNIAPTQSVPVIIDHEGKRLVVAMRWGLIPFWAKDMSIGNKMINARAETLEDKPSFQKLIQQKRCLVPADGFYEWQRLSGRKRPYRIALHNGGLFSFAGLWDAWKSPEGKTIYSFTIITTPANSLVAPIHERMPAILTKAEEKIWLDHTVKEKGRIKELLKPYPSEEMTIYEVSPRVNAPGNDFPDCVIPVQKIFE